VKLKSKKRNNSIEIGRGAMRNNIFKKGLIVVGLFLLVFVIGTTKGNAAEQKAKVENKIEQSVQVKLPENIRLEDKNSLKICKL
jgi:hypothetical protein